MARTLSATPWWATTVTILQPTSETACKGYSYLVKAIRPTGNTECQPANDTISLPVITPLDTVHIASFDLVLTANNHMLRHLARVAF